MGTGRIVELCTFFLFGLCRQLVFRGKFRKYWTYLAITSAVGHVVSRIHAAGWPGITAKGMYYRALCVYGDNLFPDFVHVTRFRESRRSSRVSLQGIVAWGRRRYEGRLRTQPRIYFGAFSGRKSKSHSHLGCPGHVRPLQASERIAAYQAISPRGGVGLSPGGKIWSLTAHKP